VHSLHGMAATSHPLSTLAAIDVLRDGGNALDAAVAACAVQCVVEPQSTGIGGDCFVLMAPGGGDRIVAFNGSGRAPAKATVQWYQSQGITEIERTSPHAVTVPGAVDAWARLLADHGTRSLGEVLAPAIGYARDGYVIHSRVASDWALAAPILTHDPGAARIFLPGGRAPGEGEAHRQPDAQAKGDYVTPIKTDYRGYQVHECPPNGQGIAALVLLNILEGFALGDLAPLSVERLHLEIEAARLAYRERDTLIGDPAQVQVPVERLLSRDHAAALRAEIDPERATVSLPPAQVVAHADTVYITVVDRERNAVSFINSLFSSFGSGILAPKTGVMLQNRGMSFRVDPDHPNGIAPGKRPMHTIIPGMVVKDGRTVMPFGVMGGHYQVMGHGHFLTNLLDLGLDLQEAIDLPRVFAAQSGPVEVESGVSAEVAAGLAARGHQLTPPPKPIGGGQAIWIDWESGVLTGASDPRKDGCALGY
jgi:gamma-glutamyltranspeptidase/glutathione hydrolase